jgi:hypothetical protein
MNFTPHQAKFFSHYLIREEIDVRTAVQKFATEVAG